MTTLISWNIQCGRGADDQVNLERIAAAIDAMGGADILCLQEVARFDPACDERGEDQVLRLSRLFPTYEPVFGPALDRWGEGGRRRQFGNMILSRLPVIQAFRHLLPQPAAPGLKHMQRQATEVVVATVTGPLRVVTTHLEFHSADHRLAQIERLRALYLENVDNQARPGAAAEPDSPYALAPRPAAMVLCGDLNMTIEDWEFHHLLAPFDDGIAPFLDAWPLVHGGQPHLPTCGVFDRLQWPQGPHCRDFFLLAGLTGATVNRFEVDTATNASDHQPLRLSLLP